MSIQSGSSSLSSRSRKVEITTTLYDLIEAIGDSIAAPVEPYTYKPVMEQPNPAEDRLIARKISTMFLSGRIKFKRPRDIRKTYPEWFD